MGADAGAATLLDAARKRFVSLIFVNSLPLSAGTSQSAPLGAIRLQIAGSTVLYDSRWKLDYKVGSEHV
jgi:hypothetical protein